MSETSYQTLREAIVAPQPGDSQHANPGTPRQSLFAFLLSLAPRRTADSDESGSIFQLRLTRQVSGWGAIIGAAVGFMTNIPDLLVSAVMLVVGGVAGSFLAVFTLVLVSWLVHRTNLRVALAVIIIIVVTAVWFFLPAPIHHQP